MNPTPFFFQTGFLSVILCGSREYILIKEYKTWDEAQYYCQQNYTDLATVQTNEEWSQLDKLRDKLQFYIWIGLYDDVNAWRWSLQDENQPNNLNGKQYCVNLRTTGYWCDQRKKTAKFGVCMCC
uniref:C-type lectin domain-containing protein n=1 Tax=Sinocyclocheilus anshuiensis TaxID=1608454 RepID=A0A671L5D4_9TELE